MIRNRFELLEPLGKGAFSTVWRARDLELGDQVALKVFRAPSGGFRPLQLKYVAREAEVLRKLDHPAITRILDAFLDEDPTLVLELHEGQTLFEALQQRSRQDRPWSLREIVTLFEPVADALQFAHDRGITHRDLKPSNVMLLSEPKDAVKLMDFGLARLEVSSTDQATTHGRLMGTVTYMAPEQLENFTCTTRSDQFALAVILFETCTLRRAWLVANGPNRTAQLLDRIRTGIRPRVGDIRPEWSSLDPVLQRALAVDPAARFESVARFWRAFREAVGQIDETRVTAVNPPTQTRYLPTRLLSERPEPKRARRRTPLLFGAAGAGVMALGILFGRWAGTVSRNPEAPPASTPTDSPNVAAPPPLEALALPGSSQRSRPASGASNTPRRSGDPPSAGPRAESPGSGTGVRHPVPGRSSELSPSDAAASSASRPPGEAARRSRHTPSSRNTGPKGAKPDRPAGTEPHAPRSDPVRTEARTHLRRLAASPHDLEAIEAATAFVLRHRDRLSPAGQSQVERWVQNANLAGSGTPLVPGLERLAAPEAGSPP
jgi:serine/threonine protein kinase